MLHRTLASVVGSALHRRKFEYPQPVLHIFFERLFAFVRFDKLLLEGGNVSSHLFVDLLLGCAGEGFSFSLSALIHVPDHTAPTPIGAFKCAAVGEQFSFHTITLFLQANTIPQISA